MAKKFKVKLKDSFGDKLLAGFVKIFKKSPRFIDLNESEIEKKSIIIGNHDGASGAFTYRTFMKHRFMTWGTHQMCEGFRSRWKYLYHIFYRQKLGYGKFKSFVIATLFGMISKLAYNYAGIIPVYYDMNIKKTFQYSFDCIEKDVSVFVFPENSNNGYKKVLEEFYSGFLKLSQLYYNKYKVDLPIYTLYFSSKYKKLVIGKPMYLQQLKQKFSSEQEIADHFRDCMNSLYSDVILKEEELKAKEAGLKTKKPKVKKQKKIKIK